MNRKYYFICGTKRSATHYLNRLFDSHPELANTINESYIFEYYYRTGYKIENELIDWIKTAPVNVIYDHILSRQLLPAFKENNIYDNALKDITKYKMDFDFREFCSLFEKKRNCIKSINDLINIWIEILEDMNPWNLMSNIKNWIFKCADFGVTLCGANKLNVIQSVIFMVRNPFDIVRSLKKRREFESRDFHVFELLEICNYLENIQDVLNKIKGKYLIIHFEDLVNDKKKCLEKICNFWNVNFHNSLNEPTLLGEKWDINTSFIKNEKKEDILKNWEIDIINKNTKKYRNIFDYI